MKATWIKIVYLLKETSREFGLDNGAKLSASLAYFTIFSIGPLLMVLTTVIGMVYKSATLTPTLFEEVSKIIGKSGAQQLQSILDHISTQSNSTLFNVVGTVVLVFGATSIFTEIQSSLNYIWSIRAKPKKGWIKYIADRVLSFSLIIGCGFLFLASLMLNIIVDGLDGLLMKLLGDANIFLLRFLNILVLFCVVTALFAIIYKVLPDAVLRWKDAFIGAAFTGLLFLIGKFGITYYLSGSTKFNAFGAASSLILLLSWVYYSSMILFFGAEFTKVYAHKYGGGIRIKKTAVYIVKWESKDDLVHAEHNDG